MSATEAKAATAAQRPVPGILTHRYPEWLEAKSLYFEGEPWEGFDARSADRRSARTRAPDAGQTNGHISVVVTGRPPVLMAGMRTLRGERDAEGPDRRGRRERKAAPRTRTALRALCASRRVVSCPPRPRTARAATRFGPHGGLEIGPHSRRGNPRRSGLMWLPGTQCQLGACPVAPTTAGSDRAAPCGRRGPLTTISRIWKSPRRSSADMKASAR